ncbi:protein of unknown function [Legionella longbeachae NSW150]|uniref:Uncharacterized protein n=1 Tax=Legionella longbeachae serogroup 1 (strain NSW150) TaxID=661367 RepID=D3HSY7_LEGLN|nr:protein of unknown function [Legionella longbeachae NSW150]
MHLFHKTGFISSNKSIKQWELELFIFCNETFEYIGQLMPKSNYYYQKCNQNDSNYHLNDIKIKGILRYKPTCN